MKPNPRKPTGGPERRTQAENRVYRRRSLLDAAIRTVARHDIHGATVERICAEAGASRGLIANYFDSKEALLLAALEEWYRQSIAIKSAMAANPDLTAEARGIEIDAAECALGLYILDDGLWNSLVTGKDRLTRKSAQAMCDRYIDGCLGLQTPDPTRP